MDYFHDDDDHVRRWRQRGDIIMVALTVIFSPPMLLFLLISHACISLSQPALFATYHYNNNSITAAIIFDIKKSTFFSLYHVVWVWMTGSTRFSSWKAILHHTTPCRGIHIKITIRTEKKKDKLLILVLLCSDFFFQIKWVYWCYLVTTVYWHTCIYSESTLIDVMAVVMMIHFICHHHRRTCWVNWKEEITLRESFKLELYNLIVKFLLWLGSPTALTSREAYKIDEGLTKN